LEKSGSRKERNRASPKLPKTGYQEKKKKRSKVGLIGKPRKDAILGANISSPSGGGHERILY